MARTTPRNLRRGVGRISGGIVEKLNALGRASGLEGHENIGSELAREINQHLAKISVRQDAQAGFGGPVAVAKQTRQSASGPPPPGLMLSGNRIGETAPALAGTDVPNYDQIKALFTCDAFGGHPSGFAGWFEDCVDQRQRSAGTTAVGEGLIPYFFGYTFHPPNATDTVEGDTFVPILLASTLVPEGTSELTQASYGLTTSGPDPITPPALDTLGFNIGLYDSSFNLVTQTGFQRTWNGAGDPRTGFFHADLDPPVAIPAGEYFEAIAINSCLKTFWCIAYNLPVNQIADADRGGTAAVPTPGRHFLIGAYGDFDTDPYNDWIQALPESLDVDRIHLKPDLPVRDWPIPIVLYG